jgi:hypothetical protein
MIEEGDRNIPKDARGIKGKKIEGLEGQRNGEKKAVNRRAPLRQ